MILNSTQPVTEKILRDNQNGFRASRSTTSHILALRRLLEGAKYRNIPAVLLVIDFKKAFDSIHRGTMFKMLRAYGIPGIIVDLIGVLHYMLTPKHKYRSLMEFRNFLAFLQAYYRRHPRPIQLHNRCRLLYATSLG